MRRNQGVAGAADTNASGAGIGNSVKTSRQECKVKDEERRAYSRTLRDTPVP